MIPGDVVLIRFPFADMSGTKVRPGLVISSVTQLSQGADAIFMAITTNTTNQRPTDFLLEPTHLEFTATGLRQPSVFRADKIHCLEKKLAYRRLGSIGPMITSEISNRVNIVLEFK